MYKKQLFFYKVLASFQKHHYSGQEQAGAEAPVSAGVRVQPEILQALSHHPQDGAGDAPGGTDHRLGLRSGRAVPGGGGSQGLGGAAAHCVVLRLSGDTAHLQQYVHAAQRYGAVGGGAAGAEPHHRPAGTGAGEAGVRHRRRALPGAGGRGIPAHPAGQQEVRGRGRAAAHLLQDHGGDAGGVRLSGSGGGTPGGHRRPAFHCRPHRGDRAAAAGTAVPAAAGELRAGAARQGVEQVPRAVRRRAAPAGRGSIERGAEEHSGQVRRGVYVRPEAGAAESGKRLSGGQPRIGGLVAGGVYVGHHGGELPAAPLPLP